MSLRVWLPLNGSLKNKGLDDITVTNNGATIDNNGKIGKCYSFGTGNSYIVIDSTPLKTFTEFSFACWVKIISWNTNYSTIFAAKNSTSTSWNNLIFSLLRSGGNSNLCFNISNGTSYTATNCYTGVLSLNTWYHIVCTYEEGKIKLYQDGNIVNTYNTTVIPNFDSIANLWIGKSNENTYQSNNLLNDVRIYDHALSPLEVKQISQGLILHYPLNRNGWGQENLIIGYDTSFLSYSDGAVTLFNNQMNGGAQEIVSNIGGASKCLHLHSNGDKSRQYSTLNLSSGKSYTISCEYYSITSQPYPFRGELQGGDYTWFGSDASAYTTPNKWVNLSFSYLNLTSDTTIYYFMQCSQNTDCYIKNLKIEEGLIATPWCPNSTDELATTMGLNDNIQYDTSGYGNNGTRIGTFSYDSDTPKYNVSTVFPSGVNWINAGRGAMIQDSITISCWINYSTWGNPISCTEGGGWNFEEGNGGIRAPFYISGIGYKTAQSTITSTSLKNGWHMLTSLYDRINSTVKIFIDGELAGSLDTGTTNKIVYHGGNVIMIGAEAGGSATSPANTSFIGKISDVRIYATALSAEDIKSLYNNSAYIDNQGNIYGAVYEEV